MENEISWEDYFLSGVWTLVAFLYVFIVWESQNLLLLIVLTVFMLFFAYFPIMSLVSVSGKTAEGRDLAFIKRIPLCVGILIAMKWSKFQYAVRVLSNEGAIRRCKNRLKNPFFDKDHFCTSFKKIDLPGNEKVRKELLLVVLKKWEDEAIDEINRRVSFDGEKAGRFLLLRECNVPLAEPISLGGAKDFDFEKCDLSQYAYEKEKNLVIDHFNRRRIELNSGDDSMKIFDEMFYGL